MTRVRGRRPGDGAASVARALAGAEAMAGCGRLTLHRVSLAATVTHASPLLLDAVATTGADMADLLDRLEAPASPLRADPAANGPAVYKRFYATRILGRAPWQRRDAAAWFGQDPDVNLHIVRNGPRLGVCGSFGRLRLSTAGASAWIWIDADLPHTIRAALPGRPVQALVSHLLLDGRDYTVLRAEPDVASTHGTVLHVRTGLRRFRTPWTAAEALAAGSAAMAALVGGDAA